MKHLIYNIRNSKTYKRIRNTLVVLILSLATFGGYTLYSEITSPEVVRATPKPPTYEEWLDMYTEWEMENNKETKEMAKEWVKTGVRMSHVVNNTNVLTDSDKEIVQDNLR